MPCIHHGDIHFGRHFEFHNEHCYPITMVMVLQMAHNSFATDYKRYEINSVNKVYSLENMVGWIAEMLFMLLFAYIAVQRTKHS